MSERRLPHLFDFRFGRFIFVGGVSAVLDVSVVTVLLPLLANYQAAVTAGFLVGLLANYALHTAYTFSADRATIGQASKFAVVVALNYGLTLLVVWIVHEGLGGSVILGKVASLPVVAVNGFLLSKLWVFRGTSARLRQENPGAP